MITGYTVQCVSVTGSPYDGETSEEQLTATGLSPNTTYNCSVSASNGQGSGPSAHQLVNTLEAREFTDHLCVGMYVAIYGVLQPFFSPATPSSTADNIDITVVVGVVMAVVVVMIIVYATVVILLLILKICKIQSSHNR